MTMRTMIGNSEFIDDGNNVEKKDYFLLLCEENFYNAILKEKEKKE